MLANLALGRAAELRVASELLLRGHEVFLTLVDSGADLVMGNGKRIQVKASHRVFNKSAHYPDYTFAFKSWRSNEGKYEAHKLNNVDFVILWAVNDDKFFIIPADIVRGKYSIRLGLSKRKWSEYMPYESKWELLESQAEREVMPNAVKQTTCDRFVSII